MEVQLAVYDLSGGMARQMSMGMLGFQLDAIYHTSILLNGLEWVYDGSVVAIKPFTSHLGRPFEVIPLGQTTLPMDIIEEYVDSLREIYTVEAYNLFTHNCNNFTSDFSTFLTGQSIPSHISNMPQAVLDSPFGQMLQPMLDQRVRASKQQRGSILGIQGAGSSSAPRAAGQASSSANPAQDPSQGRVHVVRNLAELTGLLDAARSGCAAVFFTSATCGPCRVLYPLYDALAAELGTKCTLIKADVSVAQDVGAAYAIRATPTFVTFLRGAEDRRWSGADAAALRANLTLLAQMAHPPHRHDGLRLPTFAPGPEHAKPVLYAKVPPLAKLLAKLPADRAADPAVAAVKSFVEARAAEGPANAPLPDLAAFAAFVRDCTAALPPEQLFAVVDLLRAALADPRVAGWFAEEAGHMTVVGVLQKVNSLAAGEGGGKLPYALRLVALQMACNLFASRLFEPPALGGDAALREGIVKLVAGSFLDEAHPNVRVAAAGLMYDLSVANARPRAPPETAGQSAHHHLQQAAALPDEDQVELAAAVLEAVAQEQESAEALRGMLLAVGWLVYRMPDDEGELADTLRALDAEGTVLAKKKGGAFKDEQRLLEEVGAELLGKGLRRK